MNEQCKALTTRKRRCARSGPHSGWCKQHFDRYQKGLATVYEEKEVEKKNVKKEKEKPIIIKLDTIAENTESECPICLDTVTSEADAGLPCSYYRLGKGGCVMHLECGQKMLDTRCPVCRKDFTGDSLLNQSKLELQKRKNEAEEKERQLRLDRLYAINLYYSLNRIHNE